jgi:hypothetical protein
VYEPSKTLNINYICTCALYALERYEVTHINYIQAYSKSRTLAQCLIYTTERHNIWPRHSAAYTLYTGVLYEYNPSTLPHIHYIQAYCMSMNLPQCIIYTIYRRTVWVWHYHSASYTLYTGVMYEYDPSTVPHIQYRQAYCMSMTLPQCLIYTIYRHTVWVWPIQSASYRLYTGVLYEYDPSTVPHIHYIQA